MNAGAFAQGDPAAVAGHFYHDVDSLAPPPSMDGLASLRHSMSEPATPVQGFSAQMMNTPEQAATPQQQQHQQLAHAQHQMLSDPQLMAMQSPSDPNLAASAAVAGARLMPVMPATAPPPSFHPDHLKQAGSTTAHLDTTPPSVDAAAAIAYLPVSASIGSSGAPSPTAVRPASATHTLQRHHPYAHPTHPHVIRPTVSTSALSGSGSTNAAYPVQMSPLQTTSLPASSMTSTAPSPVSATPSVPMPHRVHSAPLQVASPIDQASFSASEMTGSPSLGPPFEARRQPFDTVDGRIQLSRASTPADSDFNIGPRPTASPVQALRAQQVQAQMKPVDSPLPAIALLRNRLPILEAALSTSATDSGDELEIWQGVEVAFVELSRVMRSRRETRRENAQHVHLLNSPSQPTEAALAAGHFLAAAPPPPPLLHANSSPEVPRLSQNSIMRAQQIESMTAHSSYLPSPASLASAPMSSQMEQAMLSPATAAPSTPLASLDATPKHEPVSIPGVAHAGLNGTVSGQPQVEEPTDMQGQRPTPRQLDLAELRSNSMPTMGTSSSHALDPVDHSASIALAHAIQQQQQQQSQQPGSVAPTLLPPPSQPHVPAFPSPLGQGIAPANIFPSSAGAHSIDPHSLQAATPRAMDDTAGLNLLKVEAAHQSAVHGSHDPASLGHSSAARPSRSRATSNSGYVSASGSRSRAASGSGFQSLIETRSRAASSASSVYNHHEPVFDFDDGYDDDDDGLDVDVEDLDVSSHSLRSSVGRHLVGVGPTMDNEFKEAVDPIFESFLVDLCSNLDATDSKGEMIHQTLMAKKMERLDQSEDFRPFKFRIQAFTNAFIDLLVSKGFNEEMEVPVKRVRQYLWQHPYISRFNDDGRKAKSKGNHVWTVEAKKDPERKWVFRRFERCIKGTVPGVAFVGLPWAWAPRVWDPQVAADTIEPSFSSPSLPPWLSWKDNILSGSAPEEMAGRAVEIVAVATCQDRGQPETISTSFTLQIARTSNGMYDREMLSDVHSSHPAATAAAAMPAHSNYAASIGRISQTGSHVNSSSSPGTERSTPMHSPAARKTSFGSEQALQAAELYGALSRHEPGPSALTMASNGNGSSNGTHATGPVQLQSMGAAANDVYHMDEDMATATNGGSAAAASLQGHVAANEQDDSLMSDTNLQQYENGLDEFLHSV